MSNRIIKLGDYCDIIKGAIGIQKAIPGEYPLVVTAENRLSHNEYQFDDTAILIPLVSSTGHGHASINRLHYQEGKFALGTILCALIIKDTTKINPRFLYIYLSYFKDHLLVPLMKGAANVTLSMKKIKEVEIILPSLERQLEIIELEKNNDLVDELNLEIETQKQLLTQLKQSILQEAIQGKLTADWREQNPNTEPANELLKRIKEEKAQLIKDNKIKKEKALPPITEEEIPFELPDGWVWCRFQTLVTYRKGKKPSILVKEKSKKYCIPYIDIKAFEKNIIKQYTNDPNAVLSDKTNILLVWDGSRMGIIGKGLEGAVGSTLVKIDLYKIDFDYMFFLLSSKFKFFNSNPKQAGLPHMNGPLLDKMLIALPSIKEQKIIVEKIENLMQKCQALEQEIKNSEANAQMLMQAVLKEAFEGKKEDVVI